MSAHDNGSGPRSNMYSENRFTNWAAYEPWWLEIQSVLRRFDGRMAKNPNFPKIIELEPFDGFMRPCTAKEVEAQLMNCPPEFIAGLRAIFILSGTKKQLKSYNKANLYYGHYWQNCVFLHAFPFGRADLTWLHRFYLRDVLMHEIGHHLGTQNLTHKDRERFANQFARTHG